MKVFLLAALLPCTVLATDPAYTRAEVTSTIDGIRQIRTPGGIDEVKAIPIGGIQQVISIRGRSLDNPILLFIHGGPASTDMPVSWAFQTPWEDYFTVVQWDQRGAGKTFMANDPEKVRPTITKDRMVADAEELVQYLRTTYSQKKIFVLGHSWGSIVGIELAQRRPDWLYAYIGMGQIIDMKESEKLGYEFDLREAEAHHDETALKELRAIAPYPGEALTIDKLGVQRKWSVKYGGLTWGRDTFSYYENAARFSPEYSPADLAAVDKGSALTLPRLWPAMIAADYTAVTKLRCPIVIFNGRHDQTTSADVTARWFEKLQAPAKKLIWFEKSAHMMHIEEPGTMVVHLVGDVRPLATLKSP